MVVDILNVNMPIYTRTGDGGTTSLFGGKRVSKSNHIIVACGEIDELNSFIGLVKNKLDKSDKNNGLLFSIQNDLYKIMACLAGNKKIIVDYEKKTILFEKTIDLLSLKLPPLTNFVVPGGNKLSSWFHILRTVCRRAERNVVDLKTVRYLNRLSDLFFTLARFYGKNSEVIIKKS